MNPQEAADALPRTPLVEQVGAVVSSLEGLETYLSGVVQTVREEIRGCDEVGITIVTDDGPFTAAYTTAATLEIDAAQYSLDEGPCLEAYATRSTVLADLDEAQDRWPRFAAEVGDTPTRALLAAPLVAGDRCVGALNLYATSAASLEDADVSSLPATGRRIAEVVLAGLTVIRAEELSGQLEEAMASRAVIEQAKGILMGRHGFSETEAFELLRRQSQRSNVKLRTVAAQVVADASGSPLAT